MLNLIKFLHMYHCSIFKFLRDKNCLLVTYCELLVSFETLGSGAPRIAKKNCKIWCFHVGDYEELCLLGCYAVWFL
jgi:hypothetical protein